MKNEKQPETLWGREDDEQLWHKTADEAIEYIIKAYEMTDERSVTVFEFRRKELPSVEYIRDHVILEGLLYEFDGDYGNPDEETEIPDEIITAAGYLAEEIHKHWPVWAMVQTENTVTVIVGEWKQRHLYEDCR